MSTFLTGLSQPGGVVSDPKRGVVYVADTGNDRIEFVSSDGSIRNLVDAGMKRPAGLAVDAVGRLYIADSGHHRILRFNRYFVARLFGRRRPSERRADQRPAPTVGVTASRSNEDLLVDDEQ